MRSFEQTEIDHFPKIDQEGKRIAQDEHSRHYDDHAGRLSLRGLPASQSSAMSGGAGGSGHCAQNIGAEEGDEGERQNEVSDQVQN